MPASRAADLDTTTRDHQRAIALLALCGVLWSTAGVLIKLVDWNVGAIWSVRSAIAAAALWAIGRPSFTGIQPAEWRAACALAATTGLFILANKLTTAANAILSPVLVALAFGELPGRWALIGGAIVVGAITLRAWLGRRSSE